MCLGLFGVPITKNSGEPPERGKSTPLGFCRLVGMVISQRVGGIVNRWEHASMSGYSRDLRERIASSVQGGHAQGPGGAHLPREPLFAQTLRRQSQQRKISCPQEEAGAVPKLDEKAMRLLAADLEGRPYLTLQERCDYVEAMTGLSVSRSTMCRAIARIGPTRKKGGDQPPSATRVLKGERAGDGGGEGGEPERLVFVDECVLGTPPWRRSTATRPKGERLRLWVPRRRAKNTPLLSSMRG